MTAKPNNPDFRFIAQEWQARGLLNGCDRPTVELCPDGNLLLSFVCPSCFKRMQCQIDHMQAVSGRIKINLQLVKPLLPNVMQSSDRPNSGC